MTVKMCVTPEFREVEDDVLSARYLLSRAEYRFMNGATFESDFCFEKLHESLRKLDTAREKVIDLMNEPRRSKVITDC